MSEALQDRPVLTSDGQADFSVEERIRREHDRLTRGQRRLASFILKAPEEAVFLSSAELGRRIGVSDSTVIRFAGALGYSGYPELQQALRGTLTRHLSAVERFRKGLNVRKARDPLLAAIDVDLANLKRFRSQVDPNVLHRAVGLLLQARSIYVVGLRGSFGLAHACSILLSQALGNVTLLTLLGGSLPDQIRQMGPGDVLIAFSLPRYSRETVQIVGYAADVGCTTIAVTDSLLAPIGRIATLTLPVEHRGASFFNANVPALALVHAIVTGVALARESECFDRLSELERISEAFHLLEASPPESADERGLKQRAARLDKQPW